MKSWLWLLFAWMAVLAAAPANAFVTFSGKVEAGYFRGTQREPKNQPADHRCEIRKDYVSDWLAAWISSTPGYSVGRTKNKVHCATGKWLETAGLLLSMGRELIIGSIRTIPLNIQ